MIHYRGTQTTGREQAQARRRRTKPIARPTKAAKLAAWGRPNSGLAKTSVVLSEARRASFSSFVGSSGELTNTQLTMPVEAPVAAQVERRAIGQPFLLHRAAETTHGDLVFCNQRVG